ncbi:hypothetical protein [Limimaricola sp.]|uniref:hypothetical protein n=1 Tax=Limimaricola sp. TaxID=2211665 RepID=UPI0040597D61
MEFHGFGALTQATVCCLLIFDDKRSVKVIERSSFRFLARERQQVVCSGGKADLRQKWPIDDTSLACTIGAISFGRGDLDGRGARPRLSRHGARDRQGESSSDQAAFARDGPWGSQGGKAWGSHIYQKGIVAGRQGFEPWGPLRVNGFRERFLPAPIL